MKRPKSTLPTTGHRASPGAPPGGSSVWNKETAREMAKRAKLSGPSRWIRTKTPEGCVSIPLRSKASARPVEIIPTLWVELDPFEQQFLLKKLEGETDIMAYAETHSHKKVSKEYLIKSAYHFKNRPRVVAAWERIRDQLQIAADSNMVLHHFLGRIIKREEQAVEAKQFGPSAAYMRLLGQALGYIDQKGGQEREEKADPNELLVEVRLRLGDEAAARVALDLGIQSLSPPTTTGNSPLKLIEMQPDEVLVEKK